MEENQNTTEEHSSKNQCQILYQDVLVHAKKRNFSSYFKEFLMLFLAVFSGFMAENYRENLSNKKIEK